MKNILLVLSISLFSVVAYCQSSKADKNIGNESNSNETTKPNNSDVFVIVEDMPAFPGGEDARRRFLAENINYPSQARIEGIQGTIYISFIIDTTGIVTSVKVLRGIGGGCDEEAVRVVKLMPKWNPGKQKGKAVRVQFNMPMQFVLGKSK